MSNLKNVNVMSTTKFGEVDITNDEELYMVETPVVVEYIRSGSLWYRLWSDGMIEQGGICYVGDVGANGSVNFLKPFKIEPIAVGSKNEYGSFNESSGCIAAVSTTGITMGLRWGGDNSRGGRNCTFYAIGY